MWRKYDQFNWTNRDNYGSEHFTAFQLNPTNCSANAAELCGPITYFRPTIPIPSPYIIENTPGRHRDYNGIELAMNKRYSNRWMANFSFAYNDAKDYWDSSAGYEDPTNIDKQHGFEYAPESGGSGLDSIFTNAKWLSKASGMYTMKWDINLAGSMQFRQGYPFPTAIQVTNRGNGVGTSNVLVDPLGERRLDTVFVADLRVDKAFTFGTLRLIPSFEVFNVGNSNTIQSRRRFMYAYNATSATGSSPANANDISSIIPPRVIRFGLRVNW